MRKGKRLADELMNIIETKQLIKIKKSKKGENK